MKIIVRGYGDGKLLFEDKLDLEPEQLRPIAERHILTVALYRCHMVEIEFLEEPNQAERFFRFGTDPRAMTVPIEAPCLPWEKTKALTLPTHCGECGVVLMGGATVHKPDCPWHAIIAVAKGERVN